MQVETTFSMKIKNIIAILSQLAMYVYLVINWNDIVEQTNGISRTELISMPIIVTVFFVMFSVIEKFPNVWNTVADATEENRERLLNITKNLIVNLKLVVSVVLSILFFSIVIGFYFPEIIIYLSIVGTLAFYIVKLLKAR